MKLEYQEFIKVFSKGDPNFPEKPADIKYHSTINNFLEENIIGEIKKFFLQNQNTAFCGWAFFYNFYELVEKKNNKKFLEMIWVMFDIYIKQTGWHPWRAQFDPLDGVDIVNKYARLFREGVLRFELEEIEDLGHTYVYGWWRDLNHLSEELTKYRDHDFSSGFFNQIAYLLCPQETFQIQKSSDPNEILKKLQLFLGEDSRQLHKRLLSYLYDM